MTAGRPDGRSCSIDGGAVNVLQDFTADRDRLLSSHRNLDRGRRPGLRRDRPTTTAPPIPAPPSARTTASSTSSIPTASWPRCRPPSNMLGQLNEKKSLIYFASGLRLNGIDNQAQLQATVNAAIRANVSFWPIDARGLVAQAPLGDATQRLAGRNRHVYRRSAPWPRRATSSNRRTRCGRWPRIPAARPCSTTTTWARASCRPQQADFQLLHPRLLHQQRGSRRQIPPHQDHAERPSCPPTSITARATTPASSSASSPRR